MTPREELVGDNLSPAPPPPHTLVSGKSQENQPMEKGPFLY